MDSMTSYPSDLSAASLLVALGTYLIFHRYETYSFLLHASLIAGPPFLTASLYAACALTLSPLEGIQAFFPLAFLIHIAALLVFTALYRLSPLHPLARYPGPFPCKLSKFYMAVLGTSGRQHVYIKSLHDRYASDVVRIGPNELSIRDPAAVPALLGSAGLRKGPQFFGRFLSHSTLTMIALQDTPTHLARRRPWARGLAHAALRDYEPLIAARVRLLVDRLSEVSSEGAAVHLDKWFDKFSYDYMSDMAFGGGSELLRGSQDNFWSALEEALPTSTFLSHVPWLGDYLGHVPLAAAPIHTLMRRCEALTRARLARGSEGRDLVHHLNNESTEEPPPPTSQLVEDGILAMVAGADTVVSALTSLFACLLAHPDALARLEAEVCAFFPQRGHDEDDAEVLDQKRHGEMPWLNACINEAMRVYPPVPGCTQRQAAPDGPGMTAGSIYVPPGTNVWIHVYSMHRDARNFAPHPEVFWPERWLLAATTSPDDAPGRPLARASGVARTSNSDTPVDTPPDFVHNPAAYLPFSHGPLNCAGKALAQLELRAVVCALLRRFRVRLASGSREAGLQAYERAYKDHFVSVRGSVSVVLEPRV